MYNSNVLKIDNTTDILIKGRSKLFKIKLLKINMTMTRKEKNMSFDLFSYLKKYIVDFASYISSKEDSRSSRS